MLNIIHSVKKIKYSFSLASYFSIATEEAHLSLYTYGFIFMKSLVIGDHTRPQHKFNMTTTM